MKTITFLSLASFSFLFSENTQEFSLPSKDPFLNFDYQSETLNLNQNLNQSFRPRKSAALSAGLSALWPGAGHYYLGDPKTGIQLTTTALAGAALTPAKNFGIFRQLPLTTTYGYGVYAAYRDARIYNGETHYSYQKMPKDSFKDLALASFKWSVLKKPEVWGFLSGFALMLSASHLLKESKELTHTKASLAKQLFPLAAFLVGISEESLFRGYLQPQISEISNPLTGIVISSLLFGAAHIPNAANFSESRKRRYYTRSIPYISAVGGYFAWISYQNASIQEAVAIHSWYDFMIFALKGADFQSTIESPQVFSVAFDF